MLIDPDDEDLRNGQEDEDGDDTGEEGQEADDAHEGQEEGDDEGGQEGEGVDAKPSRGSNAVRTARERAQQAEARAQKAEDDHRKLREEVDRLSRQREAPQENAEQEAARLAMMTTDERVEYRLNKTLQKVEQDRQRERFQNEDRNDRVEFKASASNDPFRAKYVDRVEDFLKDLRKDGMNVPRERAYIYLLGLDAEKARKEGAGKQRDTAKRNVQRQTTRPSSGRSDQQAGNRRGGRSLEERLDGVEL